MARPQSKYLQALKRLSAWFERQKRVLPWRDRPTLYRVWVSEIMLQQTQVATVVPYFERFMGRFGSVEELAAAPLDDVLLHWAGLGYYSRARNLHKAAGLIVERGFPETREGWLDLPGVGPYTAGAILSIALDRVEAILDGNVERVLSRVGRVDRQKGDSVFKDRLWELAKAFVVDADREGIRASVTNQALMELGATVCSVKNPKCGVCPLSEICEARAAGDMEAFPPRKAPKKWVAVREELHCVLDREGRVLLRRREAGEWRAGLWDLPDQIEDYGKLVSLGSVETKHIVTKHKVTRTTHVWRVGKVLRAAEASSVDLKWVRADDESGVAMGSALVKTLARVREMLGKQD